MMAPNENAFNPGEEENGDLPFPTIPHHGQDVLKADLWALIVDSHCNSQDFAGDAVVKSRIRGLL